MALYVMRLMAALFVLGACGWMYLYLYLTPPTEIDMDGNDAIQAVDEKRQITQYVDKLPPVLNDWLRSFRCNVK
jgi:hypothetical protein